MTLKQTAWRTLDEVEREHVVNTLHHCLGNRTRTAELLGISLRGLRVKIRQYQEAGFSIPKVVGRPAGEETHGDQFDLLTRGNGSAISQGCATRCSGDEAQNGCNLSFVNETRRRSATSNGALLNVSDLPKPDTARWVPSRKAIVLCAVQKGLLSIEEACRRYALSREELATWEFQVQRSGLPGLRTGKAQLYRPSRQSHGSSP